MKYTDELRNAAASIGRLMDAVQPVPAPRPSLTVVGTGIRAVTQLTLEAVAAMASAESLLHVIGEPIQEDALLAINPNAKTMTDLYADGMERSFTYEGMVLELMAELERASARLRHFTGTLECLPTPLTNPCAALVPPVFRPGCCRAFPPPIASTRIWVSTPAMAARHTKPPAS